MIFVGFIFNFDASFHRNSIFLMLITALGFQLLLLLASIIGIVRYKNLTIAFKAQLWLVVVTLILAILGKLYAQLYHNNIPFTHLDAISNFTLIAFTYYKLFRNKWAVKFAMATMIAVNVFMLVNAIWLQPFFTHFSSNSGIGTLIIFEIFSLSLFKQMLSYPVKIDITKQSIFWFNIAILFYSTTMFLNFALENYYVKHMVNDNSLFYFWYFILYVFFILIGVSLLIDKQDNPSYHAE